MVYAIGEVVEDQFLGGRWWSSGGNDDGDREVVIMVNESLGELSQWDEVTHPWTR